MPLGYLVFRSGFLPKVLGVMLMLDCVAVLVWFLQFFILPGSLAISYPCSIVGFLVEVSLTLWLLIKGIEEERRT